MNQTITTTIFEPCFESDITILLTLYIFLGCYYGCIITFLLTKIFNISLTEGQYHEYEGRNLIPIGVVIGAFIGFILFTNNKFETNLIFR